MVPASRIWAALALVGILVFGVSGQDEAKPKKRQVRDNFEPEKRLLKPLSPEELDKATQEFFEQEKETTAKAPRKKGGKIADTVPLETKAPRPNRLSQDVLLEAKATKAAPKTKDFQITLKNGFIEKYKNRAAITTPFRVVHAGTIHTAKDDGDLHFAGLADEVNLACVAEMMNAKDYKAAVKRIRDLEDSEQTVLLAGAWRLWCEHPGHLPQIQDDVIPEYPHSNPDHVFEIHPVSRVGDLKVLSSFRPIPGYKPKDAKKAFRYYESLPCRIEPDPETQTTTLFTRKAGYNYVEFQLQIEEDTQFITYDGRIVRGSALTLDGEEVAHNRRMIFVAGTPPEEAVRDLKKGDTLHVLGIPRIDLALVSWRARNAESRPDALEWNLPYEIIVVAVYDADGGGNARRKTDDLFALALTRAAFAMPAWGFPHWPILDVAAASSRREN